MDDRKLREYQTIAEGLGLSPKESEIFACKAIGMNDYQVAAAFGKTKSNTTTITKRICTKLGVGDLSEQEREEKLKEIAEQWLTQYRLIESIAKGDGDQMLTILHEMNDSR